MDLIERRAVLKRLTMMKYEGWKGSTAETIDVIKTLISVMPSAQPAEASIQKMQDLEQAEIQKAYELGKLDAEPQWIPCSERLPEPRAAVLGYAPKFKNIFALYYDSVMGWMVWSPIRDDCLPNSQGDIIAWMPLPEPYKGETE